MNDQEMQAILADVAEWQSAQARFQRQWLHELAEEMTKAWEAPR
jgi:hypothetical protein